MALEAFLLGLGDHDHLRVFLLLEGDDKLGQLRVVLGHIGDRIIDRHLTSC